MKEDRDSVTFSKDLFERLHSEPETPFVEFRGRVFTRGEYAELADRTIELIEAAGIGKRASIAVIVRNRPLNAAAMLGLIADERWLTSVYAMQSPEHIAAELREARFSAVIADAQDWTEPVLEAARACGTLAIRLDLDALDRNGTEAIDLIAGLDTLGTGPFREVAGEPGLEILSSGTTGKPKRIVFPTRMLVRAVESVMAGRVGDVQPDILCWPYGGIGGMLNLVASTMLKRFTYLLERFTVDEWVNAVERLKPRSVSGVPTIARMILDAKVAPEKLASVEYFYSGSAPMTAELQNAFEQTYGIAVIPAYGATEFCGTIIAWTPDLHKAYRQTKAGAMGRALPGISLRVTDTESGAELPVGSQGFLEALVPAIGDKWIKTTDLVVIDEDGFVFHHGRGDGAILRGGHKILPEKVVETLRTHPAVFDAAVVGVPDDRLGALPMAAVELKSGVAAPTAEDLREHCRLALTAPQVPARIVIVPALPRTTSLKPDLKEVTRLVVA
jgi:acyl-coenzyme A synthetase/AMP-(fatty) acid ligase